MNPPKTTDLCDACADAQVAALPWRGFGRRRAFAGAVRTVRCHEDVGLLRDVLAQPGEGRVLVVDGGGSLARAIFGDVMAALAIRNGWAGLVIHGAIRDTVEIDAMDIGVKALGSVPMRGHKAGTGAIDEPVGFGGACFVPGRRLVADEDGVIVLPEGVTEADVDVEGAVAATAAYAAAASPRR